MSNRHSVRWILPLTSALAGICCASALTSGCWSTGCDCAAPRPIVDGEFTNVTAVIPDQAPPSLQDIEVTRMVIDDGSVVVHYLRGAEPGTATFTFGNMY